MNLALKHSSTISNFRLFPKKSLLLCVDMQERLATTMDPHRLASVIQNARLLIQGAVELGIPIVITEQYRKGLGETFASLREVIPQGTPFYEKITFSIWEDSQIRQAIEQQERNQLIMIGMEAHVCVFQSARDLLEVGYVVHIPQDIIISRSVDNRDRGLLLSEQAGAIITTTETVLFDWVKQGGTPSFKKISALVKNAGS